MKNNPDTLLLASDHMRLARPGEVIARGVMRHLVRLNMVCVEELAPTRGLRVDVMALGPKGEIWIIECKSSRADFTSDQKWHGYLDWCDRYFWAVDEDFPTEILPPDSGYLIADAYDAEIIRWGDEHKLSAPRRKTIIQNFARVAARRLQGIRDPEFREFSV